MSKLLIQVSNGTYKAKMEAGSMTNLRIEENGALMQQVRIRTSKITPPNELWVVVLPSALKKAVLEMFHGNESRLGHMGGYKTHSAIKERFKWTGMKKDVKAWLRSCHYCLSKKGIPPQHRRYNLYEETMAPMNRIAIDLVCKLPNQNEEMNTFSLCFVHSLTGQMHFRYHREKQKK